MKPFNKILVTIGAALTGLFVLGLLAWAANLTILAVRTAIPDQPAAPYLALVLFDGGALAWLFMFLAKAKGTGQRTTALVMTALDLAGEITMSAGGLHLIAVNAIAKTLLVATLLNVVAWFAYEITDPDNLEAIQAQNLEDELTQEAMRQAQMNVKREALQLGAVLSARVTSRIKYRMRLPMSAAEVAQFNGETVEGTFTEAQTPALPSPTTAPRVGVLDWLMGFFGRGRKQPQPKQSEPTITSTSNDSNSNEQPAPVDPPQEDQNKPINPNSL